MSHAKLILVGGVLGLALAFGLAYTNASDYLGHRATGTAAVVSPGHPGGHCRMHGDAQLPVPSDGVDHAAAFNALLNTLDTTATDDAAEATSEPVPDTVVPTAQLTVPLVPAPARVTVPVGNPPEDYTTPTATAEGDAAACGPCGERRPSPPVTVPIP